MLQIQEHERLVKNGVSVEYDERYNSLELVQWDKPVMVPLGDIMRRIRLAWNGSITKKR